MRQEHPAFIWVAYGVLVLLNVVDLVYTEDALRLGMREGNPFMARIYEDFNMTGLVVAKGVGLAIILCSISTVRNYKLATRLFYFAVFVYTCTAFYHLWLYLVNLEQLDSVFTLM